MTTKLKISLTIILVCVFALHGDTNYFKERFESLQYSNASKTTADWNTYDQIGAPGRLSAREVANVTTSTGRPVDVATNGKYVFIAMSGAGGLSIHNALNHTRLITLNTGLNEQGVAIYGRYAYLVNDGGRITRVDCGDVTVVPYVVNNDHAGTDLRAVEVSNGWLYIASSAGLIAKNDYNGSSFTVATTNARDVAIYGAYILLADGNGGLRVYQHSNTGAAPTSVGSVTLSDCRGVSVYGSYAIVAAGDSVFIVDVGNPASPSVVNRLGTAGNCNSACAQSGKLYAACGSAGTMVFVGETLTSLRPVGITQPPFAGSATSVVAVGHEVAVAQNTSGTVQYLSQGNTIQPSGSWTSTDPIFESTPIGATIHGDYLYVSEQTYGLIVYDLNTMTRTAEIPVPGGTSATGLCAEGNYLLQGLGVGGLRCYSLADPSNPSVLWTEAGIGGGTTIMGVASDGVYAYVAAAGFGTTGIYKIPILGGSHAPVASRSIAANIYDLCVNGKVVYAAATSLGLIAMNLDLDVIDSYDHGSGSCDGIICENDYAYVAYGSAGLLILDIGDVGGTSGITLAGGIVPASIGDILAISRFDKYLCVGQDDHTRPLMFVDVFNPPLPGTPLTSLAGVPVPNGLSIPASIMKWNENLIVVDYLYGVYSWEAYPNDCTDSLIQNSTLHSKQISSLTGVKYLNWKAWEFFPSDNKDTCDYTVYYYRPSIASFDTLRMIYSPSPGFNEYSRPIPPPWAEESWYQIDDFAGIVADSIWWFIDIAEHHDSWANPDSGGLGGPYSGVWFVDSLQVGYSNGAWPGARARTMTIHVDFGGESQDLIFGMDSSTTDRYDPALDVPFVLPISRPYACWTIDDPATPVGVGFSAFYSPAMIGARPVRLVLSHPATLRWTIPPGLDNGAFILDGVDMASTTEIDLPAGEYKMIPAGGFALGFQTTLRRGWNLVGLPALPITESATEAFNTSSTFIWSYNDAIGGYYNPEKIEQGKAYFVFAERDNRGDFCGVISDRVRTKIHPGWNLISGPASGEVHITNLVTRPDGAFWEGPLYRFTDEGYEASEWISPGAGYWLFGLADAELFIDTEVADRSKVTSLEKPELLSNLRLVSGGNETNLGLGIHPNAIDGVDSRFDRLQPPSSPGSENIGYLFERNSPAPLSMNVNREGLWELHIRRNCTAYSELPLVATKDGVSIDIGPSGAIVSAGIYKIAYSENKLPELITIAVRPNPFNAVTFIKMDIPFECNAELAAYDINGRKVNTIFLGELGSGTHSRVWRGTDDLGRNLPTGIYYLKLKIDDEHSFTTKAVLLK